MVSPLGAWSEWVGFHHLPLPCHFLLFMIAMWDVPAQQEVPPLSGTAVSSSPPKDVLGGGKACMAMGRLPASSPALPARPPVLQALCLERLDGQGARVAPSTLRAY